MSDRDGNPASVTPEALERVVLEIARERGASGGSTIAVGAITDRVLAGVAFASQGERSRAQLRIGQEIARLAAHVEGLQFFENE